MHELADRLDIVVDVFEQHGLRPEGYAGIGKPRAGLSRFGGAFVRMDKVQAHPDRMIPPQHTTQFACDSLRQLGRHLCADADELDIRN